MNQGIHNAKPSPQPSEGSQHQINELSERLEMLESRIQNVCVVIEARKFLSSI
jgi:hypothetical protein